jgi:hypothetical protein
MNNRIQIKLMLSLFGLLVAACSPAAPSSTQISDACKEKASATNLNYYVNYLLAYSNEQPRWELVSGMQEAASVEGTVAKVVAICSVKYRGRSGITVSGRGHGGFEDWIGNGNKERFQDGDIEKFRINLMFRKYDTGWRLEGH